MLVYNYAKIKFRELLPSEFTCSKYVQRTIKLLRTNTQAMQSQAVSNTHAHTQYNVSSNVTPVIRKSTSSLEVCQTAVCRGETVSTSVFIL